MAVLVLAIVVGGTSGVPQVEAATSRVRVPVGVEWVNTGIAVSEGEEVHLDAQGCSTTAPLASFRAARSGPDGQVENLGCGQYEGAEGACALDDAPYGALVSRVGPFGNPFLIGGASSFTPRASGPPYLTVGDNLGFYPDNLGGFAVLFPASN